MQAAVTGRDRPDRRCGDARLSLDGDLVVSVLAPEGARYARWILVTGKMMMAAYMSSHSGSLVTVACNAAPTPDWSVKIISDWRSSATPSPVTTAESPVT